MHQQFCQLWTNISLSVTVLEQTCDIFRPDAHAWVLENSFAPITNENSVLQSIFGFRLASLFQLPVLRPGIDAAKAFLTRNTKPKTRLATSKMMGSVWKKRTFFLDPDETFEAARRIWRECQHHI
jgi:hypothetical protein